MGFNLPTFRRIKQTGSQKAARQTIRIFCSYSPFTHLLRRYREWPKRPVYKLPCRLRLRRVTTRRSNNGSNKRADQVQKRNKNGILLVQIRFMKRQWPRKCFDSSQPRTSTAANTPDATARMAPAFRPRQSIGNKSQAATMRQCTSA